MIRLKSPITQGSKAPLSAGTRKVEAVSMLEFFLLQRYKAFRFLFLFVLTVRICAWILWDKGSESVYVEDKYGSCRGGQTISSTKVQLVWPSWEFRCATMS